jgi:hypothetical protein
MVYSDEQGIVGALDKFRSVSSGNVFFNYYFDYQYPLNRKNNRIISDPTHIPNQPALAQKHIRSQIHRIGSLRYSASITGRARRRASDLSIRCFRFEEDLCRMNLTLHCRPGALAPHGAYPPAPLRGTGAGLSCHPLDRKKELSG